MTGRGDLWLTGGPSAPPELVKRPPSPKYRYGGPKRCKPNEHDYQPMASGKMVCARCPAWYPPHGWFPAGPRG